MHIKKDKKKNTPVGLATRLRHEPLLSDPNRDLVVV